MAAEDAIGLADSCLEAYRRLNAECLAFMEARVYLLTINLAANKGIDPTIKEAHDTFLEKLKPRYESPHHYFVERAYISLVASFELFLQDIVTAVVVANPKKIGQVEFKLSEILDSSGQEELVQRGIEFTLNKIMYKKPLDYLGELAALLSIEQTALRSHWPVFVEAKARRDLGVHNGWRCNAIYLRKVIEAGGTPSVADGEFAFPSKEGYVEFVLPALSTLANLILDAVFAIHVRRSANRSPTGEPPLANA